MLYACIGGHESEVALFKEFCNRFCVYASTAREYGMGYVPSTILECVD